MSEPITRILVPLDFSPHADRAFRYALALARRFGASVELLHVVEDPFVTGAWTTDVYVPNVTEVLSTLIDGAEQRLRALQEAAALEGVKTDTLVRTGLAAHTITGRAADGGFNLIVMGTHGRTGLSHVLMGSVAERVVRTAPCPVLSVRAAGAAAAQSAA